MIINTQPIEKKHLREDGCVEVVSIFDTIQGEGPFAGEPAVFIRLAGCNLDCRFCDTDYTSNRKVMAPVEVVHEARRQGMIRDLVVITGGEPFRQRLDMLVVALLDEFDSVQIETNGTLSPEALYSEWFESVVEVEGINPRDITIVCSPKTPVLNKDMVQYVDAFKYVVQAGQIDQSDGLPLSSVGPQYGRPAHPPGFWDGAVYVQPLDENDPEVNKRNQDAAVASCMRFGYKLCLQMHKIVGLD